jgi:hypothetical protein
MSTAKLFGEEGNPKTFESGLFGSATRRKAVALGHQHYLLLMPAPFDPRRHAPRVPLMESHAGRMHALDRDHAPARRTRPCRAELAVLIEPAGRDHGRTILAVDISQRIVAESTRVSTGRGSARRRPHSGCGRPWYYPKVR